MFLRRIVRQARPFSTSRAVDAAMPSTSPATRPLIVAGVPLSADSNVPAAVADKVGRNLHLSRHHPLNIIKTIIEDHFREVERDAARVGQRAEFRFFDDMCPVVTTKACFDDLLTPKDHVSRSVSDTYYVCPGERQLVLRTHTSAHQNELMQAGHRSFLASGDVYRRDEIDSSHYPCFHQMEGVHVFDPEELPGGGGENASFDPTSPEAVLHCEEHLKRTLEGLVRKLFGEDCEMRWGVDDFPFTDPSFELEVFFRGDWLEVLGCGVVHREILQNCGLAHTNGWAFGLGLERLAMVLFQIPDIRLFWSEDPRFLEQFTDGEVKRFRPFSKYPPCYKDVSFWLPAEGGGGDGGPGFHENDLFEQIRAVGGDMVEAVEKIDEFIHPKTQRKSQAYRITWRHMSRTLTDAEVDKMQFEVRDRIGEELGCEVR
jgi:phenylalanyl-tRNA synthetase alpha chain